MSGSGARESTPGVHRVEGAGAGAHRLRRGPLGRPGIVYRSTSGRREIALTFDDGPSRWTAAVASTLEEHGCRATFFIRGGAIEERPDDLVALTRAGHELGNHLWSHSDATTQGRAEIRAELKRTGDAVKAVTGKRPALVRPPYCKGPERVADAARWTGMVAVIQFSIGSNDWDAESAEEVSEPVLESAMAGDIVCLHDGISSDKRDSDSREVTVAAVKRLVPALLERGLRPVTVSQLFARG